MNFKNRVVTSVKSFKHSLYLRQLKSREFHRAKNLRKSSAFLEILEGLEKTYSLAHSAHKIPQRAGIWGIAMVKNEADIIETTAKHLLAEGVDQLLIADNGSTDGTLEILCNLAQTLPVTILIDNEPAYYQAEKMTWLADQAHQHGATWVVPFDADELWFGLNGNLAQTLGRSSSSYMSATLFNQFPQENGAWLTDIVAHPNGKVCFKPDGLLSLNMGNHSVAGILMPSEGQIAILHRPWRSFEQFEQKVRQGTKSLELATLPAEKGWHWRALNNLSSSKLHEIWRRLVTGQSVPPIISWKPQGPLYELEHQHPTDIPKLPNR